MSAETIVASPPPPQADAPSRMISIDVLRGFDMFWIVGGEGIAEALHSLSGGKNGIINFFANQLDHVEWEGFHFYDLIFPLFAFIIGISIVFSLDKIIAQEGKWAAHKRIVKRFILLFLLGIIYYGGLSHQPSGIRVLGVLQRLALCYLFASLLYANLNLRGLIISLLVCLLGYWLVLTFIPAPGQAHVSFEPGKNLTNWFDYQFLPGRLWDKTWDPEGILSTIPAIGTSLLGVFTGLLLKNKNVPNQRKVFILAGAGALMVVLGTLWGFQFPVIKKIWTSSYVLVAGGYSCLLVAAFYQVVDLWRIRFWTAPFLWIGSNALTIYLAWQFVPFRKIAWTLVGGNMSDDGKTHGIMLFGHYEVLAVALVTLMFPILLARFMYKRQIFIRI